MTDQTLSDRLARIARDIQSGEDVGQAADEICAAATELIHDTAGAGITLVHRRQRVETASATADVVREGDRLQYELEEGPCLDAAWEQEQVYTGDLANDRRWPTWGPRVAMEYGVHSMLCTQLFTNEHQLGALNIYSHRLNGFDDEDHDTARLLGAHAAVAVAAAQEIENLKLAVDRRTTIGKALGIVMVRYGVSDDHAMAVLRRLSSHQNTKLYEIAVAVVRDVRVPDGDTLDRDSS